LWGIAMTKVSPSSPVSDGARFLKGRVPTFAAVATFVGAALLWARYALALEIEPLALWAVVFFAPPAILAGLVYLGIKRALR
jgi:hypothetical protein